MYHRVSELFIEKPCSEDWSRMVGGARTRFCEQCTRQVVNTSGLTAKEAELLALRAAAGDEICVRLTKYADDKLVTLPPTIARTSRRVGGLLLSASMTTGLSAVAQKGAPAATKDASLAVITGRVLKPGGAPVQGGLVFLEREGTAEPLYVLDQLGRFEIHLEPGVYTFVVQTGPEEAERMPAVSIHPGVQSFGDVLTQGGRADITLVTETFTTMGELTSVVKWSWKARLRHPILYVKALTRRTA